MNKNASKESNNSGNHGPQCTLDGRCQPVAKKAAAHGVEDHPPRVKSSVKRRTHSTLKPIKSSVRPQARAQKAQDGTGPMPASPQLMAFAAGHGWKVDHERGRSFAELARESGCSRGYVRDLVLLASMPEEWVPAYLQGLLSMEEVIREMRGRKKKVETRLSAMSSAPQKSPGQNLSPVILEEEEQQNRIAGNAALPIHWFSPRVWISAIKKRFSRS